MSDTNATKSLSADVKAIVAKAFADLEDVFAGVKAANENLGTAEKGRDSARRNIMDECAKLSVAHNFTDADIAAGVKAAIAAYQGNAIAEKTLANLGSELKNIMHPKVRAQVPALRAIAAEVFTKMEKTSDGVRAEFQRADFMVSRIAGDVAKGRVEKMPENLAAVKTLAKKRETAKAENLGKAKAKIKAIVTACDDMARVFPLSQLDKIKALLGTLLEDDVLADALASTKKAAKAASNLRAPNGKEKAAKAAPAEGASDMDDVLNDAA
jgi:hypothetical protein